MPEEQRIVLARSQRSGTEMRRQRAGKPLQRQRQNRRDSVWETGTLSAR